MLALFLFPPLYAGFMLPAIVAGLRPVEFPRKVFVPGDLPGVKLLLPQEPFPHEIIHKAILEVHSHRRVSGPVVSVVVSDGGIFGGPRPARIAGKLKQADRILEAARQQERVEKERKRATRRKYDWAAR